MIQCRFEQRSDNRTVLHTTGFVSAEDFMREGTAVEIEGKPGIWVIMSVGHPVMRLSIRRGWNNNI